MAVDNPLIRNGNTTAGYPGFTRIQHPAMSLRNLWLLNVAKLALLIRTGSFSLFHGVLVTAAAAVVERLL